FRGRTRPAGNEGGLWEAFGHLSRRRGLGISAPTHVGGYAFWIVQPGSPNIYGQQNPNCSGNGRCFHRSQRRKRSVSGNEGSYTYAVGARPGGHLGNADMPKSLGVVEVLSDADQMDLYSFEEVLKTGEVCGFAK